MPTPQAPLGELTAELLGTIEPVLAHHGVPGDLRALVAADVTLRAGWLLGEHDTTRSVLLAPWLERAAFHLPAHTGVTARAEATAVVRNSVVEDLHAVGVLADGVIVELTASAAVLFDRAPRPWDRAEHPLTVTLRDRFPASWSALAALGAAWATGVHRLDYHVDDALPPAPLLAPDTFHAPAATGPVPADGRSGRSLRLAPQMYHSLCAVLAGPGGRLTVGSLTQLGRGYLRLFGLLEAVLTRSGSLVTVNYLLGPDGGHQRVPPRAPASGLAALAQLADTSGADDAHAAALCAASDALAGLREGPSGDPAGAGAASAWSTHEVTTPATTTAAAAASRRRS